MTGADNDGRQWEDRARAVAAPLLGCVAEEVRLGALSVRPGREVYVCRAGDRQLVAKCFPDDDRAAVAARALELLGGEHGELVVPRCLGHETGSAVVAQEWLPGRSPAVLLAGPQASGVVERVARAVARLHGLSADLATGPSRTQAVANARVAIGSLERGQRRAAERAIDEAARRLGEQPATPDVPSHGDLGWAQVLMNPPAVGLVDFDKAHMAQRGLDVGNLVAQLVRSRGAQGISLSGDLVAVYEQTAGVPVSAQVRPFALLILCRKLAWLPAARRGQVLAALELLQGAVPD